MEVDEEEVMEVDEEIEVDWGQMDEEMGVMEKEMDGEIEVDGELRDEEQMDEDHEDMDEEMEMDEQVDLWSRMVMSWVS